MPRKRELGDVAEAATLPGESRFDQVTQLVNASEADAELRFMAQKRCPEVERDRHRRKPRPTL